MSSGPAEQWYVLLVADFVAHMALSLVFRNAVEELTGDVCRNLLAAPRLQTRTATWAAKCEARSPNVKNEAKPKP